MRVLPSLLLLAAAVPALASAQIRPPSAAPAPSPRVSVTPEPGSDLTVTLLTMGVGEQVWEQFGHNAIWISDRSVPPSRGGPVDVVYNYGLFDFNQPHFIPRFLQGRMRYSMGGFTLASTLEEYRERDRTVWAQELDLTPAQRRQLADFLVWNALPENRDYNYDYYRDNCSTRVRDALDRVLGGVIRARFGNQTTGHSYRWHTLRLTQVNPLLATGIDIGLGRRGDREMTAWQEMFLPMKLRDYLRELRVPDADGAGSAGGAQRPLVKREWVMYESRSHQEPPQPPRWMPVFLVIGLSVGALFALLGTRAVRGASAARIWAGAIFALWCFAAGILGLLLVLLWTATDHVFAHRNENVLLFNPLWLVLVVLLPLALAKGHLWRTTRALVLLLAGLGVVALVMHVVGLSRQSNGWSIALALPPMLGMTWTMLVGRGRARVRD